MVFVIILSRNFCFKCRQLGQTMSSNIFRPEALHESQGSAFGTAVVSTPIGLSLLTGAACAVAMAVALFLGFSVYSRKSQVVGYLVPDKGIVKVFAPVSGIIVSSAVHDGQEVGAGEALYELNLERSSAEHAETQAMMLVQLRAQQSSLNRERDQVLQLATVTQHSLQTRIHLTDAEITQLVDELHTRESRVDASARTLGRYDELLKKKFVSELQVTQQRSDWLGEKATVQSLQRSHVALERDVQTLRDQVSTEGLNAQSKQEQIDRELASLAQQITQTETNRSLVVRAPTEGVITSVIALPGQQVAANAPLLTIMPRNATLEAHLMIPPRAIGFIKRGEKVLLRYQAFPYERYGHQEGTVSDIARTVLAPSELPSEFGSQEPAYRVKVALAKQTVTTFGTETRLQAGMLLDADVLLDERRLYQWVLEPLYSVTGRL
jgi:membrane fusion protein